MSKSILALLFIIPLHSHAQDNPDCFAEKDFLIIASNKIYENALLTAQQASVSLGVKLDLRNLLPANDTLKGLTLPPDSCLKLTREYDFSESSCYFARGRYDDGVYISIEYSNSYLSFQRGYYIVIMGSGFKNDPELISARDKVVLKFPNAYIKTSKVYMCCNQ